jgi:hypothetical protein
MERVTQFVCVCLDSQHQVYQSYQVCKTDITILRKI